MALRVHMTRTGVQKIASRCAAANVSTSTSLSKMGKEFDLRICLILGDVPCVVRPNQLIQSKPQRMEACSGSMCERGRVDSEYLFSICEPTDGCRTVMLELV